MSPARHDHMLRAGLWRLPAGFVMKNGKPRLPRGKRKSSGQPGRVLAPPEALLGYHLWQVHYAWHRHIERQLRVVKLTHLQYVLLAATSDLISDGQVPSQSSLARFTKLEKMMVSKNLRALERRGYVARNPHPENRRANEIGLTESGRRILKRAFDAATVAHREFFHAFGKDWHRFDEMLRLLMPTDVGATRRAKR